MRMTDHAIIFAPTATGQDITIAIGAVHQNPDDFGIAAANEYLLKAAGQMAGSLRFAADKSHYDYHGELPHEIVDHVVGYIRNFR
jgi:hypothetical protein